MRTKTRPADSHPAKPNPSEIGEYADMLARQLWRMAEGRTGVTPGLELSEAAAFFHAVADQLREPYVARPALDLPSAIRFTDRAESRLEVSVDSLYVQRQQASEMFDYLAHGIESIAGGTGSPNDAGKIADLLDLLGSTVANGRSAQRRQTRRLWSIE
jgi:hypothetical protein